MFELYNLYGDIDIDIDIVVAYLSAKKMTNIILWYNMVIVTKDT